MTTARLRFHVVDRYLHEDVARRDSSELTAYRYQDHEQELNPPTMDPFILSTFAGNNTMSLLSQNNTSQSSQLTPLNVALALTFIAFDSVLSITLGLGIASSLIVAASRCILQLSVMALVLGKVFATGNVYGVFGIAGKFYSRGRSLC
jgi:hypothetical protein